MVDLNPVEKPMLKDGRTALHYAASTGDSGSVAELLAAGSVDANAQDAVGYSAVQIAAAEGHLDVLQLLLRHDANVNLHDNLVSLLVELLVWAGVGCRGSKLDLTFACFVRRVYIARYVIFRWHGIYFYDIRRAAITVINYW